MKLRESRRFVIKNIIFFLLNKKYRYYELHANGLLYIKTCVADLK